ncbi:MAG: methyltransferase domain-containing protein [Micropepsaceae bacterium]
MHCDQGSGFFDPLVETEEMVRAGRALEAAEKCERLIKAGRGSALTRAAYGRVLVALGRVQDAIDALREASHLSPNTTEVLLAFGEALALAGLLPAAIGELQRASRLSPQDGRPHLQIARLWLDAGEPDKALDELETAIGLSDFDQYVVAEIRDRSQALKVSDRSAAGYVKHLFNQFASDYDTRMQQRLGYSAPAILRQLAGMLATPSEKFDVLDLGCGTGLSGLAFMDLSRTMIGVDLSPRMLERAAMTGAYSKLVEGDVERVPEEAHGPFALIVAADVLVYLGNLSALFGQVRRLIHADGLWLFTTERGNSKDFELGPKRRFRHSEDYLRKLASDHNFEVASLVECVTRYEAGQGVASWAAAFRACPAA